MNQNEYIRLSLELNLFFSRIMKEHSIFLEIAFMEKDKELKRIANDFHKTFSNILEQVTNLANKNISSAFLSSQEVVTSNTLEAENQTSRLSGIPINTDITRRQQNLLSGNVGYSREFVERISYINRQALLAVMNLISFKEDILRRVLSCNLFTANYPLLIKHITNEAKMYHKLLTKIENKESFSANYIYEQEVFWNTIMMEHAEFIRGLLDPSEETLIITADTFAKEYKTLISQIQNNPNYFLASSLNETLNFKKFKVAGEEGILNCKIKSIIIPLLADHVVREANHFIRILRNVTTA